MKAPRRGAIPYRDALKWLLDNDDTEFLDLGGPLSVAASFAADIYQRSDDQLMADLLLMRSRQS